MSIGPSAPEGLRVGSRIAGYLLQEQIGQGGMAVVFRALDERLQRHVALKLLNAVFAEDEAFRQRFMRESRAAAAVDDPHIIPVFDAGESSGVLFIAMRYVQGGDVGTLLHREGALQPSRAAALISPVASALDAAHIAGLVHRDVKPTNMLLDMRPGRREHVYLSDFGLSKAVLAGHGLTATGQFLGTVDYVAPEQIQGGPLDGRADQYSLACSAFELLTGATPFRASDAMATVFAQLSQPPPPATGRRPDLPNAVDGVVARAMSKDPADRYPTCQQFADALEAACSMAAIGEAASDSARPDTAILTATADMRDQTLDREPTLARHRTLARDPTVARDPTLATDPAQVRDTSQLQTPRPARRRSGVRWAVALAAAAALAAVAVVVFALPRAGGHGGPPPVTGCTKPRLARPVDWSAPGQARKILDVPGGSPANVIEGMAFSPGGATLAVGTFGSGTYLVNPATGSRPRVLKDPGGKAVEAVAFSCQGVLAVADKNGSAYLWRPRAATIARPARTVTDPARQPIRAVAFSPDGTMLAIGDEAGNTYIWRVTSSIRLVRMLAGSARIQAVAFSQDGRTLATGDVAGKLHLWRITQRRAQVRTLSDQDIAGGGGIQAVTFGQNGSLLAAGDGAGNTYLWRTAPGSAETPTLLADPGYPGQFGTVALAFSGATLAAGGYTGQIYLWDTATHRQVGQVTDPGTGLNMQAVAFSGPSLAGGDTAGSVYLWRAS